jgi:hypothetical protein
MNWPCRRNDKLFMLPHDHVQVASSSTMRSNFGNGRNSIGDYMFLTFDKVKSTNGDCNRDAGSSEIIDHAKITIEA